MRRRPSKRARENEIEKAIANFEQLSRFGLIRRYGKPSNKTDKVAIKSLVMAMKRLAAVLARKDVRRRLARIGGPLRGSDKDKDTFLEWEEKLKHYRERFDEFATCPLRSPVGRRSHLA